MGTLTAPSGLAPATRRLGRGLLDLVLPPLCLACRRPVEENGALCAGCWSEVTFIAPSHCAVCGFPFEYDPGDDAVCAACAGSPPAYDRARAVLRYDDASRSLVLGFKHGDQTYAAPAFGRWLARGGAALAATADVLVPVPLHRFRLMRRRYNQAMLLARRVGRECGVLVDPDLLVRRRPTATQGRLSPSARRRNVQGAFTLRPGAAGRIDGRHVLLLDDVLTTGATVEECARVLRRGGAAAVDVLTLARVVRPQS